MKALMLAFAMLITLSAQANCLGEAQMNVTTVRSIQKHATGCRVFVNNLDLVYNRLCPLDETILYMDGIEVGMGENFQCRFKVGQEISGVLVFNGEFVELE